MLQVRRLTISNKFRGFIIIYLNMVDIVEPQERIKIEVISRKDLLKFKHEQEAKDRNLLDQYQQMEGLKGKKKKFEDHFDREVQAAS